MKLLIVGYFLKNAKHKKKKTDQLTPFRLLVCLSFH